MLWTFYVVDPLPKENCVVWTPYPRIIVVLTPSALPKENCVVDDPLPKENCLPYSAELELIVSVPLRLGKKVIAHHTLLACTGMDTLPGGPPPRPPSPSHKAGDVIWAKADMLPAWPGKILDFADADIPAQDRVSSCYMQ